MNPIQKFAYDMLERFSNEPCSDTLTLEGLWGRAELETVLHGKMVDPPVAVLKDLTTPDRAWDNQPWPPEDRADRATCLASCHLLAISLDDVVWLEQLDRCWNDAQVAFEWERLSRGQIGFALRRHGRQPTEWYWDDDTIEWLIEEGSISRNEPSDRAWIALAKDDHQAALVALEEYQIELNRWIEQWDKIPGNKVYDILRFQNKVMRLELRALKALVS